MIHGSLLTIGVTLLAVILAHCLIDLLAPDINLDAAFSIVFLTFIGTAIITLLVLKYRRSRTATMIRSVLISLGVGVFDLAIKYGIILGAVPPKLYVASAFLTSAITFGVLSLPLEIRLLNEWWRTLISLAVAFLAAVFVVISYDPNMNSERSMSIFAGVFIGTAVVTSLVLRMRGRG
jgi:hypothetical protein